MHVQVGATLLAQSFLQCNLEANVPAFACIELAQVKQYLDAGVVLMLISNRWSCRFGLSKATSTAFTRVRFGSVPQPKVLHCAK